MIPLVFLKPSVARSRSDGFFLDSLFQQYRNHVGHIAGLLLRQLLNLYLQIDWQIDWSKMQPGLRREQIPALGDGWLLLAQVEERRAA